jgi:nitroimidazol reductase NimA-like FMN-containing flavoprotein (pyridoxamine 5'-phosphate oxidase superfamily)
MKTIVHTERGTMEELIKECSICFVGMADTDGTPYVLPMNFGYQDGVIYLHSGPEGRKLHILERNPRVCITLCAGHKLVYQHPDVACSYSMQSKSIVAWGTVVFEEDYDKKIEILNIFMKQYSDRTFTYGEPAIRNVKVWKVVIEEATCKEKEFGVSRKNMAL